MVKTCCVKNCDIAPKDNVTCFRFPNNRLLKRKWIDAIGLSNKLTANSTVCIKHFHEGDYDIVRGRPRLKAKVIPSVFSESDKQSRTACITEDNNLTNDINTDITLKSLQQDNLNSVEATDVRNEDRLESNSKDERESHDDGKTEVRRNGSDTELGNEIETESKTNCNSSTSDVVSTELQNEDREELHNACRPHSEDTESQNVQKDRCIDLQNESVSEVQNDDSIHSNNEAVDKAHKDKPIKPNGVILKEKKNETSYQDSFVESTTRGSSNVEDLNKDIEDIIVNYQIKQTRTLPAAEEESITLEENGVDDCLELEEGFLKESDPVFIEVAVQGDRAGSPRDCLMVLESVEVELDPSNFLADGAPDDCHETVDLADDDDDDTARDRDTITDGRPDPISLLTSSDEDEVIIQEPHIDTVEVSDETDEDDLPLVKLLKKAKRKKKARLSMWNAFEYFCMDCQFTSSSRQEYKAHTAKHSTILQVCEICDYTTASKSQFSRHKRKHKDDRKFKCHLCDYKARHNMSLIYHLKTHRALSSAKKGYKCDKCGFQSDVKTIVLKHVKLCSTNVKKYSCDKCVYETKRQSDLKRHAARRHNAEQDDDDEEFVP